MNLSKSLYVFLHLPFRGIFLYFPFLKWSTLFVTEIQFKANLTFLYLSLLISNLGAVSVMLKSNNWCFFYLIYYGCLNKTKKILTCNQCFFQNISRSSINRISLSNYMHVDFVTRRKTSKCLKSLWLLSCIDQNLQKWM